MSTYFYRVNEFMTSLEKGAPYYSQNRDFEGETLLDSRSKAMEYYAQQVQSFESEGTFVSNGFSDYSKQNQPGGNPAYSLTLSIVEKTPEGGETDHIIAGDDEETVAEGRKMETEIYKTMGVNFSY
jgi:hypothetical protein